MQLAAMVIDDVAGVLQRPNDGALKQVQGTRVPGQRAPHNLFAELHRPVKRSRVARVQLPGLAAAFLGQRDFVA